MTLEALQARLRVLEEEILRLTKQASEAHDQVQQDDYWRLAQDFQREARELRSEIRRLLESSNSDRPRQSEEKKTEAKICSTRSREILAFANFP